MLFQQRLLLHQDALTDSDDLIAAFILDNPTYVPNNSIQHLSKELYMSVNTIVRFAKKLDYLGFSDLKSQLHYELQQKQSLVQYVNSKPNLQDIRFYLPDSKVKKIVSIIEKAQHIHFFGFGDNQFLCEITAKQLRCTNKKVHFYQHKHDMLFTIHELTDNDLIFAISMSGETDSLIEVMQQAKKSNATIISLTHHHKNPLEQLADITLFCYAPIQYSHGYDVTDRTYALSTLRYIIEAYWQSKQ